MLVQMELHTLACAYVARFPMAHRPVLVCGLWVGDPCAEQNSFQKHPNFQRHIVFISQKLFFFINVILNESKRRQEIKRMTSVPTVRLIPSDLADNS